MESTVCLVCVCTLFFFIDGVHCSPDPQIVFGIDGEPATFHFVHPPVVDYFVLYRVSAEGEKLLLICSRSKDAHPESQDVDCGYSFDVGFSTFFFRLNHINASKGGDYRVEGWTSENMKKHQRSFRLTVCAEGNEHPSCEHVTYDSNNNAVLCNLSLTEDDRRNSLQLYRYNVLVLDTRVSLEPLVEDLKGRLHVDLKTFQLTVSLSGITDSGATEFSYASFIGAQCQSYHRMHLNARVKKIFAYEGESVTLPCISNGQLLSTLYWDTPIGSVYIRDSQIGQLEEGINRSHTGNHSLRIPYLSIEQHSGWYQCVGRGLEEVFSLYVCTKSTPLDVMFSNGGSVLLQPNVSELDRSYLFGIQWFHQKFQEPQVLKAIFNGESGKVPEYLGGRFTEDADNLKISNLTAEDSGSYTWRAFDDECHQFKMCSEGTIQLVYADPSDWTRFPFHLVYAPLIGCAVLGQVAVLICFCLRRKRRRRGRRREQISECQSKLEEQQSGDD